MRILGVLDLLRGQVVRGVAGRRQDYRPIVSQLTPSSEPLEVASALRSHLGLTELYLADLDAIAGSAPALPLYRELREEGFRLWVDAGVGDLSRAREVAAAGVDRVVVGLETLPGPAVLADIVRELGERTVFSLDLREGRPLGNAASWDTADPWCIAGRAVKLGISRLLVLDLARVGVGTGTGTEELRRLAEAFPHVELSAGGGVRGPADLRRLQGCGVRVVLVASACHDGLLTRADLEALPTRGES